MWESGNCHSVRYPFDFILTSFRWMVFDVILSSWFLVLLQLTVVLEAADQEQQCRFRCGVWVLLRHKAFKPCVTPTLHVPILLCLCWFKPTLSLLHKNIQIVLPAPLPPVQKHWQTNPVSLQPHHNLRAETFLKSGPLSSRKLQFFSILFWILKKYPYNNRQLSE